VVVPHPIQQNKVDKTSVGGVVGVIRRKIIPIQHMPQLPTLIHANHFPIVMHMGMMLIIVSCFTQNYDKVNHKTPMLAKAKVLGKVKRGKMWQTKYRPPSRLKANPTPWRLGLYSWRP
jgi:hypothetical protein